MGKSPVRDEIVEQYRSGWTVGAVARHHGLHTTQVSRILHSAGVRALNRAPKPNLMKERRITKAYEAGETVSSISRRFKVRKVQIPIIVRRNGGTLKSSGGQPRCFSDIEIARMSLAWKRGTPMTKIAQQLGTDYRIVARALKGAGVETGKASGPLHGRFRGGRVLQNGYWRVLVSTDDPMAAMRTSDGYVLEHRLVMARKLDRALRDNETVHHINGDRADNRPENLQLRQGKHGKHTCHQCADCGSRNIVTVPLD